MAVQMYEVIADKYVGKHKIYKKGQFLAESEIMGGDAGKKLALEGQKNQTREYSTDGKVDGKKAPARKLKDVPAKLKKVTKVAKK